ncbi:MAG TPA: cysteine desulfurase family protein [Candidatus Nanoarchaeia archaeon]|nr:cysteine desulfurase family protein [Candidatus Nanoarchaeia archaeon]
MIYLDNAATTRTDPTVLAAMEPFFTSEYGNASSIHQMGKRADTTLNASRKVIADRIGASPGEIIFTSGGTESDALAIRGSAYALQQKGRHLITSSLEHAAVLETCKQLEREGFSMTFLSADAEGFVKPETLRDAIQPDTILVSIMHGNNEVGTIQDLAALAQICKHAGVRFHSDAVQTFCKVPIDVRTIPVDLLSLSAHKIHGPKGIGALYVRQGTRLAPQQRGGEHEFKLRAGTVNVPGAMGFAKAVELCTEEKVFQMTALREYFIAEVQSAIPDVRLNGSALQRLCNNVSLGFKHVEADSLLALLDEQGICVSTGSACESYSLEPSHVLQAMKVPAEYAQGTLRFTLSRYTTKDELDKTVEILKAAVEKLRKQSGR